MNNLFRTLAIAGMLVPMVASAAPVGTSFQYQGRLTDNGATPTALYDFEIQLHDDSVSATLVGTPNTVTLDNVQVTNGLYTVTLDFGAIVNKNDDLFLQIGVRPGASVGAYTPLTPRRRVSIAPFTARNLQDAYNAGGAGLGNVIGIAGTTPVSIQQGTASIELSGPFPATIRTFGSGLEKTRLWGQGFGELLLTDTSGDQNVTLSSNLNSGGYLALRDGTNEGRASISGSSGGGQLFLQDADETNGVYLDGGTGLMRAFQLDGHQGVNIIGESLGAGLVEVLNTAGTATLMADGDDSNGARLTMTDGTVTTIIQDANGVSGGAEIAYRNSANIRTILIDADTNDDGQMLIEDQSGNDAIFMHADGSDSGGEITLYDNTSQIGVEIQGQDAEGGTRGQINLYNSGGTRTIQIDGDVSGDGRVITNELQITGGSDLSEQFDISGHADSIVPGSVVCIDVNNPGKLVVSDSAYCQTVAGIISGANGIETGLLMGQKESEADGAHAVALTGRVYCLADATHGAIMPGNLLTTSDMPGHAMKATDRDRAHGAIIGKAMTGLESGTGMVLVLVSLQ